MSDYLQQLIEDYERDLRGNQYSFTLSDGEKISFEITKRNVPHLLGIGHLSLRQVQGRYAAQLYTMLKNGRLTLNDVVSVPGHKEVYKKIMNFHHITDILYCGDSVKVVKKIGSLNTSYLFYLDHRPYEIIHLGVAQGRTGDWYPESLLILQRNVTTYIDGQIPLDIVEFKVNSTIRSNTNGLNVH